MTWSTACNSLADLNAIVVADADYDIWLRAGDSFSDASLTLGNWDNVGTDKAIRIATSDGGDGRNALQTITGWTNISGNIWQATHTTQPQIMWFDGRLAFNIEDADPENSTCYSGLNEDYEWCHDSGILYMFSSAGDPDDAYTAIKAPDDTYGFAVITGASNQPVDLDNSTYSTSFQNIEISYMKFIDHDYVREGGGDFVLIKRIGNVNFHHNYLDAHEDGQNGSRGSYGVRVIMQGQSGTGYVEVKNNILKNTGPKPMADAPSDVYTLELDNDTSAYYLIQYNQISHSGSDTVQIRKFYSSSNWSTLSYNRIFDAYLENWVDMKMAQYYIAEYNWFWNKDNTDSSDDGFHIIVHNSELSGGSNQHWKVRYNKFQDLNHDELLVMGLCTSENPEFVITDGEIYGNYFKDAAAVMRIDDLDCVSDIDFYNNIVEGITGYAADGYDAAIEFVGQSGGDIRIFNNTIYSTAAIYGIEIQTGEDNTDNKIENNIIYIDNASGYPLYDHDTSANFDPMYNHLWNPSGAEAFWDNTSYTDTTTWVNDGHTDGEIEDPQLNNVGSDEFWPSGAESNVVGRGVGSNLSSVGITTASTWFPSISISTVLTGVRDRGAYEYAEEPSINSARGVSFGGGP
jgi:hypothetical protein